jgi:hypothetical protein
MKPPESKNAKKNLQVSLILWGKSSEVPPHFPSWHPEQLSFHFPKPAHSHPESHTNNLHLKKISSKSDFPIKSY